MPSDMPRDVVLVVTEADDPHADLVIDELTRRGRVRVARLDPGDFPHTVTMAAELDRTTGHWRGSMATATREVELREVTAVYWRRPSPYQFASLADGDAEFAAAQAHAGFAGVLTSLFGATYVNHPHRNRRADDKPAQLTAAADLGFHVPPTLITSDPAAARDFTDNQAPVVFKPLHLTDTRRDGRPVALWTQRVEPDDIDATVAGTAHLFQAEVVDKIADLRVTVVGDQVFCVRIESGLLDWRSDYDALTYQAIDPPPGMADRLHAYLSRFGLTFGCFDFAVAPDGVAWFLECNPNGQWAWLEEHTGAPMTAAFADVLEGTDD